MTIPCPTCGATMRLRYRRANAAGSISTRHDCPGCGHHQIDRDSNHQPRGRRFDDATIRAIRSAETTPGEEAKIRGCSRELIRQIRSGMAYRDSWDPALPVGAVSCHRCIHWGDGGCRLDMPEAIEIGPQFARECAAWGELQS